MKTLIFALAAAVSFSASADPVTSDSMTSATRALSAREAATLWSQDGLQRVYVHGLDLAYERPDVNLGMYRKVRINPVQVALRRHWARDSVPSGTHMPRTAAELTRIQDDIAWLVRAEVARELDRGGYEVVANPGEDVLDIDLRIVDVHLNSPDLPTAGIVRIYTMRTGEMTMIADVRDSLTGKPVLRARDHSEGQSFVVPRITSRVEEGAEIGFQARGWAHALRHELSGSRTASR